MANAVVARMLQAPPLLALRQHRLLWLLLGVYTLDRADRTLVGALAPSLRSAFGLSNTDIGVVGTAYTVVSALATLPAGVLTDRVRRTRLLAIALVCWGAAMLATGAATSFGLLVAGRAALGIVQAAAGPAIPSLTGDVVHAEQRSRAMAVVDSGQLLGIGAGYLVAGMAGALLGWRWAFWLLAPPAIALASALWRAGEPARTVRDGTDSDMSLWRAAARVLRVKTYLLVVVATSIGEYFFAGLSTFAVVYVTDQYGINQTQADLGLPLVAAAALGGLFGGAQLADRLRDRGSPSARVWVGAVAYLGAAGFAVPAIMTRQLLAGIPLIMAAVGFLNAATPTLDAVRLDVIRPDLRGRAESLRTLVLTAFEGSAPLAFGLLADHLAGGGHAGLELALLITLPAVAVNGLLVAAAVPFYPREAAAISRQDTQSDQQPAGTGAAS